MTNKEKNKYMEQPDDFSLHIKDKLDDFRMPVDTDIWDNIYSQITPQPQPSRVWLRWVSSAAAIAAVIAVVFLIIPDKAPITHIAENHPEMNIPSSQNGKEVYQTQVENKTVETTEKVNTATQHKQTILASTNVDLKTTKVSATAAKNIKGETLIEDTSSNQEKKTLKAEEEEEKSDIEEAQKVEEVETTIIQTTRNNQAEEKLYILPKKKTQSNSWLLAASMNSSGSASSGINIPSALKNSDYDPEMLGNTDTEAITLKDPGSANTQKLSEEDFSNIEHDIPLSFGISVRKDLSKHFGLETGLVYTYLSSKMERTNIPQYRAKQEIHYIGIPVSVVAYIWNTPKWNIYISGGGMIEKGLKQKYTQEMYQSNNLTSSISESGSVNGVQLSLSASAGISYTFYQNLSLYAEPRFSYYFKNDQPLSVRTDKQSAFGIGGGIRYKF